LREVGKKGLGKFEGKESLTSLKWYNKNGIWEESVLIGRNQLIA